MAMVVGMTFPVKMVVIMGMDMVVLMGVGMVVLVGVAPGNMIVMDMHSNVSFAFFYIIFSLLKEGCCGIN